MVAATTQGRRNSFTGTTYRPRGGKQIAKSLDRIAPAGAEEGHNSTPYSPVATLLPGLLGVLTGYGPSLHVVGGSSGLDPNALPFTNSNIGSVYSDAFTVHIDSAWADNPIGAILHGIFDVLGSSTRNPCP
jgi:hypothetical protein